MCKKKLPFWREPLKEKKTSLDTLVSLGRGFPAPRCICRSRGPAWSEDGQDDDDDEVGQGVDDDDVGQDDDDDGVGQDDGDEEVGQDDDDDSDNPDGRKRWKFSQTSDFSTILSSR